jgi:hypothetical protein
VTTIDGTTTIRRHSAVTIVGAITAVGAAVAVAGLGTFGGFTDSTSPVGTKVDTGVLSIDVSAPGGSTALPFGGGLLLAGDSRTHRIDLVNDGSTALSSVTLKSWATSSSVLDSDPVNGLQLTVESCSVSWVDTGSDFSCSGSERSFYAGPIVATNQPLAGAASLVAGGTDHLLLTATLPTSATGDAFEGAESGLNFMFTGAQRSGGAR